MVLFRHIFKILEMSKFTHFDRLSEFKFKIGDLVSCDRLEVLNNIYKKDVTINFSESFLIYSNTSAIHQIADIVEKKAVWK